MPALLKEHFHNPYKGSDTALNTPVNTQKAKILIARQINHYAGVQLHGAPASACAKYLFESSIHVHFHLHYEQVRGADELFHEVYAVKRNKINRKSSVRQRRQKQESQHQPLKPRAMSYVLWEKLSFITGSERTLEYLSSLNSSTLW